MALNELLENTLNPLGHIRQQAELIIQNSVTSDEFIIQLADYSFGPDHPIYLRQLSLILIIQQTKRRLKSFSDSEREYFLKLAFFILNSSDSSLKNCGTSLLSSLFVNGTSLEQQKIAAQLFSALHENENISPILLSLRCLNEIIEETNLTTQVKMLATLSSRFHELTQSLPWKQDETAVEVLCFISKVYRKVATKASECKLADEIPANETEILVGSFGPWIEIVIVKLSESFQTSEEIFTNLSLLLEIIKFICIAFESFPYLYEVNEHTTLPAITALCWKYLLCLIEIKHLNAEELKGYETASEDGDRVSIDIFVILIFELLQICLSASGDGYHQDSCSSPLIGSNELINLIRVSMRYIQLSSEQYDQATYRGNEFIAAEEDDTLELSLRHTGKIFLKNLSKSSFKDLMESIFEILETDLNEFNQIFVTSHISFEWILKLEAMIFTLAAIGRPIMKKYFKSIKGEMSVSCSPAPFVKRNQTQRHKKEMEETINENDTVRLSQIIHTLVNNLYQFPSNAQDLSPQEVASFSSLAIVRGGISKLLTIYSPILVKFISLQPIISISLNLSLLPSMGPNELYPGISEPLSSRLLHCRAFGELLRVASKTYDPMTITQNPSSDEQSLVQVALQSCIELCPLCNDSTIHIPLEIMTNILNIVTQAFEMEFQSTQQPTLTSDAATLLSDDVVIHLVRIGLTVWSVYCYDPFALEMAKDMLYATVHCCSFRPNTLATFLEQFVPPIEHFIGELVGNQSSKMISDLAVKLLAESVSRTSSFSAYGPEASQRLSLPTIQAISRIMHFSTDVDGLVDVGNTLQSLVILLSSKHFTPGFFSQNGGDDLIDDFIQETLLCIRMIFSKSMDYNYSSAIGSLYQLVSHFPSHSGKRSHGQGHERGNGYQEFIQQTVSLIMSLGKTNNHRNILIMGLVHIFNKNPLLIAESLGHIKLINPSASGGTEGGETALQYLLEVWFELHPLLEAPYSLSVSTNGLIELIRMYSLQGISSGFLIRVLRLLLETLPSVMRNESQPEEDNEEQDGVEDELSSEDDYFFSDEEDLGDDDVGENGVFPAHAGDEDSPFAPAELYLSDLIDINNARGYGGGCGSTHVYIPNDLAYSPYKQDPLYHTIKISSKLAVLIATAEQQPTGILFASLSSLHPNEQQLLKTLLSDPPESSR